MHWDSNDLLATVARMMAPQIVTENRVQPTFELE